MIILIFHNTTYNFVILSFYSFSKNLSFQSSYFGQMKNKLLALILLF